MDNSKRIFVGACMSLLIFGMVAVTLGSVLPEIVIKFKASQLAAGVLTSLLPIGIMGGSLLFGPIADRYGYKELLIICCLFILLGLEGIAFGSTWGIVQLSVISIGLGGGALNGATNALVADISEGERSAKLSLLGIFYGLGAIVMPFLLAILSNWISRETIFIGIGGFVLFVIIYLLALKFPIAKQSTGVPIKTWMHLLQNKVLLGFSIILFFQSGMEITLSNWITSFLQEKSNTLPRMALIALTMHMVALTTMRLILSRLLNKYTPAKVLAVCILLNSLGCVLFLLSTSYSMVVGALILMGLGFSGTFPIVLAQIGNIWPRLSGTAFSIALLICMLGGTIINYFMGLFDIDGLPLLMLGSVLLLGLSFKLSLPSFNIDKN